MHTPRLLHTCTKIERHTRGNTLRNTGIRTHVHIPSGTQICVRRHIQPILWQCPALNKHFWSLAMIKWTEFAGRMEKTGSGQHSSEFPGCPCFSPRHNSAARSLHNLGHLTCSTWSTSDHPHEKGARLRSHDVGSLLRITIAPGGGGTRL